MIPKATVAFKLNSSTFYQLEGFAGIWQIHWFPKPDSFRVRADVGGYTCLFGRRHDLENAVMGIIDKTFFSPNDCIICDICGEPKPYIIETPTGDVVCKECNGPGSTST